jgi:hypothetical protein
MKINRLEIPAIISAYTNELIPMITLAQRYNVTRAAIYRILKHHNVDTSKKTAAHIKTVCTNCGKEITVTRCIKRHQLHSFCSNECYHSRLHRRDPNNPLITNRHVMRMARKTVEQHGFFVEPGMIVHHEDRNKSNNEPHNLKVFATQGDHVRHHRGFTVLPVWEGINYTT